MINTEYQMCCPHCGYRWVKNITYMLHYPPHELEECPKCKDIGKFELFCVSFVVSGNNGMWPT